MNPGFYSGNWQGKKAGNYETRLDEGRSPTGWVRNKESYSGRNEGERFYAMQWSMLMENIFFMAAMVLLCYLLGSIPTGLVLSRAFAKIDIREQGSHNIGATNVYRTLGKKLGVFTLLGDMLKGLVPVFLVYRLTGAETWVALAAMAAFLGHVYSVYLKFSGGKGVATALGVLLVLAPTVVAVSVVIFVITVLWSRYVSLGSILASLAAPLLMVVGPHSYPPAYVASATGIALLITFRHRENIHRIIAGQESKVGSRKG